MGPLILQKDDVDRVPKTAQDTPPWGAPPAPRRADWRVVAVLCVFGIVVLLLLYWLIGGDVRDWVRYGDGGLLLRLVLWGLGIGAVGIVLRRLFLVEQPGGFRVPLWQLDASRAIDGAIEVQRAYAATPFRQVGAYTLTNPAQPQAPALLTQDAEVIEQGPDVGPLPPAVWLDWLDRQPHALFAAKTGGGKSTLAKAGLKPRIGGGEQVFIIDPHSNGWFDLPGVGGGENWRQVEEAMLAVQALYKERLNERDEYKQETGEELDQYHFPRLTVVLDEANTAQAAFDRIYAGSRKRTNPWPAFAQVLGSGARKVGISIWLLVQSALVEDLAISGAMRENFTRFALDDHTIRQLVDREERQADRKRAIYDQLPGLQFPAVAMVEHEAYLLDRSGLDRISPPANSRRAAWDRWDYAAGRPATPCQHTPQFPPWCQSAGARAAYLAQTTKLTTREIRAALNCDYNLVVVACRAVRGRGRV